jgi:hypothetical protein
MSSFWPKLWWRDSNIHLVLSAFTPRSPSPASILYDSLHSTYNESTLSYTSEDNEHVMKNLINKLSSRIMAAHILPVLSAVSRDSTVDIATGSGLDDWGVGFRVPLGSRILFLHVIPSGSGAHPACYRTGTGGSFPRLIERPRSRKHDSVHPLPHTSP